MALNLNLDPFWRSSVGFDRIFDLMDSSLRFQPEDSYPRTTTCGPGKFLSHLARGCWLQARLDRPLPSDHPKAILSWPLPLPATMSRPTLGECANADNQSAKDALAPIDHRRAWGRAMARIVIVEDEIQVLMLAESVLQQAGHDTVSASTVAEAQALINSKDEKFDLVFADVELGGGVLALV